MIGRIYEADDLRSLTGYTRLADLESCLERLGIRYFRSRKGPWTTEDALNSALGIVAAPVNDGAYNPQDVL